MLGCESLVSVFVRVLEELRGAEKSHGWLGRLADRAKSVSPGEYLLVAAVLAAASALLECVRELCGDE